MTRILGNYGREYAFNLETHHKDISVNTFNYNDFILGEAISSEKTLNLMSDNKKMIVTLYNNIYPFLCVLDQIFSFIEEVPDEDKELIVDLGITKMEYSNFSQWAHEILGKTGIKYTIIDSSNYDYINIKNFVHVSYIIPEHEALFSRMYENCLPFVKDLDVKPFRKVFISRKDHEIMRNSPIDSRCDDQKALEDIFLANGFEICYPERDFNSFSEQVSYFYESKIVVGLSGGGLTNTIFMQPSQTVMELLTTFKFDYSNNGRITEELHDYYQHIAYIKKHMLITISNRDRKTKSIEDMLTKFNVF